MKKVSTAMAVLVVFAAMVQAQGPTEAQAAAALSDAAARRTGADTARNNASAAYGAQEAAYMNATDWFNELYSALTPTDRDTVIDYLVTAANKMDQADSWLLLSDGYYVSGNTYYNTALDQFLVNLYAACITNCNSYADGYFDTAKSNALYASLAISQAGDALFEVENILSQYEGP